MPVDASIALGVRPMQIENPMNQLAQVMQLKNAQQSNALNAMTMEKHQRDMSDENQLRDLTRQAGGDLQKLRDLTYGAGNYKQGMVLDTALTNRRKAEAEAENQQLQITKNRIGLMGSGFAALKANPTAENAALTLNTLEQNGALKPEQAQQIRAIIQAKPDSIGSLSEHFLRLAVDADKQLTFGETQRHNRTTEGLTAQGQALTKRGQDLTDDRARDFNLTKVEENNIKRDEKRATADMTKNSQIASFDTMLGTLDRLAAHPGLKRSVGVTGAFLTMPGSESANFQAELNTFQSQAFLPMVAQLKGMGALSDAEGKKLTAAVGALDPKMGEPAFRDSVARITEDMEAARARMTGGERRAGKTRETSGQVGGPKPGTVEGGYRFKGGDPADAKSWEKV